MKIFSLIIVLLFGSLLVYCTLDFPSWGDPTAPASLHVSPRYIEQTLDETSVPNIVTAVLADYRSYDTMFETIVIFTAGVACIILLRTYQRKKQLGGMYRHVPTGITLRFKEDVQLPKDSKEFEHIDLEWVPYDIIIKTACRLIVPFSQIFALYVIAHGHHSPGGGFQGGVILGASVILFAISHNLRATLGRISERTVALLCGLGVFMYAGTGLICMIFGANFLDYSALAHLLPLSPVAARSFGILIIEIGVGIAVMAVMIQLYYNLASAGKHDEGL
ncbi:MAG: Na(+)/H(+) antiporter subunit B [Desulfobacterales bacterium]|nr:Na(+)/H(+) antiporter subunit B [Desulfobacterales bacterium]